MPRVRVIEAFLVDAGPFVELLLEERVDEQLLVGEAPVDGADADAGVMSDVVQRHGEAPLREELPRRVDDALPVSLGVLAKSCFSTHSPSLAPKRIASVHLDNFYLLMVLCPLETDNHRPLRSHGLQTSRTNLDHHARWTPAEQLLLVVLGGVVFLDTLDLSLVQVALPSIGSELHLPEGQLQWIVSAFVLGYGGVFLFLGRRARRLRPQSGLLGGPVPPLAAPL